MDRDNLTFPFLYNVLAKNYADSITTPHISVQTRFCAFFRSRNLFSFPWRIESLRELLASRVQSVSESFNRYIRTYPRYRGRSLEFYLPRIRGTFAFRFYECSREKIKARVKNERRALKRETRRRGEVSLGDSRMRALGARSGRLIINSPRRRGAARAGGQSVN